MNELAIDPASLAGYLASRGWRNEGTWRGAEVWQGADTRLLIPPQREYPDDDELLAEAVAKLAVLEDRPAEEILLDIAEPLVDTVDVRTQPDTPSGTIPLLSGVKAVDSICELLDTAARTVEEGPRLIFTGRRSGVVQDFLGSVRLGTSKPGSYIFTARVPVASRDVQASLFEEDDTDPFGRQVLVTMDKALRAAQTACTQVIRGTASFDIIEEYVDQGVSADLCEAVSGLAGHGVDRPFSIAVGWARGLDSPSGEAIEFSATMAGVLSQAAKQLRDLARVGTATITGVIEDLHYDDVEPPRIKIRGELQTSSSESLARAIWVVLSRRQYESIAPLHYQRATVRVRGRLTTTGRRLEMRPDRTGVEIIS
ncbi:hypothetical protein [Nonomuraea jiangxiensis]|uniref:Uncharacterized protein n=1 Tax=Nonomuraea jiangxiensis TaxID=633440 RepID=A0A1G9LNP6_9ACTN|nr:hypothetical protein [Nonomuraea jiangxiensis]SDL63391.1 hypothetical protein SAMN05421869_12863 [Nonomuraea jiangxiensis]